MENNDIGHFIIEIDTQDVCLMFRQRTLAYDLSKQNKNREG
jgi:hypothetical protein